VGVYYLDNNQIRRKLLEILYKYAADNPGEEMPDGLLKEELDITKKELKFNVDYLYEEGYVNITTFIGGDFDVKINSNGINLVEDNSRFNNKFPLINLTQNFVHNSSGVVINSNNVNINIDESFNQILFKIEEEPLENKNKIKDAIKTIEKEFKKENINKSEIQESIKTIDLLKGKAYWIIPMIAQVITSIFLYKSS
jgi:hypothetical protein